MTTIHADSQIKTDAEATTMLLAALASPEHRDTYEILRGRALGSIEMLELRRVQTPAGALHQVTIRRVLNGEPIGFDCYSLDVADAVAVWENIAKEYVVAGDVELIRGLGAGVSDLGDEYDDGAIGAVAVIPAGTVICPGESRERATAATLFVSKALVEGDV